MTAALGVNPSWLFSGVFFVGALLAGLAGALQLPREPANLNMDLTIIADVFVVTVVGGLGSIPRRFRGGADHRHSQGAVHRHRRRRAVRLGRIVRETDAGRGIRRDGGGADRSAVGIVWPSAAPHRDRRAARSAVAAGTALRARRGAFCSQRWRPRRSSPTTTRWCSAADMLIFALFAVSLHFIMGPGGMASFGHAAYFGLGAYAAALAARAVPMELALIAGAARGGHRRAGLRLVLRAPLGRLSCDADARVRADHLGHRLPVGRLDRRQQRSGRRLAGPVAVVAHRLLLADAGDRRRRDRLVVARSYSRRSAMRCARRATRRGAPPRSASTCAPCAGRDSCSRACSPDWPDRCTHFPKAASRPNRCRYRARSTAW